MAWDSRMGLNLKSYYYRSWGLKHIQSLEKARSIWPYKFVEQLKVNDVRFINVFRFQGLDPGTDADKVGSKSWRAGTETGESKRQAKRKTFADGSWIRSRCDGVRDSQ